MIDNYIEQASDEVKKGFEVALKALENAGHKIIHKNMVDTSKILSSYYIVATAEASAVTTKW